MSDGTPCVVVIVGADSFTGAALVEALLRGGCLVAIVGGSPSVLRSLLDAWLDTDAVLAYPVDIADQSAVHEAVSDVTADWGPVSHVMHMGAGSSGEVRITSLTNPTANGNAGAGRRRGLARRAHVAAVAAVVTPMPHDGASEPDPVDPLRELLVRRYRYSDDDLGHPDLVDLLDSDGVLRPLG